MRRHCLGTLSVSRFLVFFRREGITDGVPGVTDGTPHLHAAGTFQTGSFTPEGTKISLGAMLRLEVEPQSGTFRVTVRAVHGTVAGALVDLLATQLGSPSGLQ